MMFIKKISLALAMAVLSATTFAGDTAKVRLNPLADLQWYPTEIGPEISPILGDMRKGQHMTFLRFTAGMTTPPHVHSNDYYGVIIKGIGRRYVVGQPETKIDLPSGSHYFMPANLPHISSCEGTEDCIFLLYQDVPFDFHVHE